MLKYKKPKLGSVIYFLTRSSVSETTVAFRGKDSFLIEEYNDVIDCYKEWFYDNYNINWFTSFDKAKKQLFKNAKFNPLTEVLVGESYHPGCGYWEIIDRQDLK